MDVEYCEAKVEDLHAIYSFVDFWLSGGGLADGVTGAGHDFFVPLGRHQAYLKKYKVLLAKYGGEIVGWAVKTKKGVLIHLLVAGTFRARGIGGRMLELMQPDLVRSKFDQSAGDPGPFYIKHGFVKQAGERQGKKKNIDIFIRQPVENDSSDGPRQNLCPGIIDNAVLEKSSVKKRHRTIDVIAERIGL